MEVEAQIIVAKKKDDKDIRSEVNPSTQYILWGATAGRCEFQGCNKLLYRHDPTKNTGNYAEKAHIRAVSPGGARYVQNFSKEDKNNIENLMLVCHQCHIEIDRKADLYSIENLYAMKKRHEQRIECITDVDDFQRTTMLTYFSKIKDIIPFAHDSLLRHAVIKDGNIPETLFAHDLSSNIEIYPDGSENYYNLEFDVLKTSLKRLEPVIKKAEHLSIFSLAPQPLLIALGYLLSDLKNMTIFQCHRDTDLKWTWKDDDTTVSFVRINPQKKFIKPKKVALKISLSGAISDSRLENIVKNETPIFEITIADPNRTFVQNKKISNDFVKIFRSVIEDIRNDYPECERILLFPVMPNSLAVHIGADFMPKIDLPIEIYDHFNECFNKTITIGEDNDELKRK